MQILARDDHLRDLGLTPTGLADLANHSRGTLKYQWPRGMAAFLKTLFDEQRNATVGVVEKHATGYGVAAGQFEAGDLSQLRSALQAALQRNLQDFDTSGAGWEEKGRERLYWLGVALADRPSGPHCRATFEMTMVASLGLRMWWAAKSPAGPGFTRVGGRAGGVGQLFAVDLGDGSVRGGAVDDRFLGDVGRDECLGREVVECSGDAA